MLELGCGTGRVLAPIVADGVDATGLDAFDVFEPRLDMLVIDDQREAPISASSRTGSR